MLEFHVLFAFAYIGAVGGICAVANVLGGELCHLHQLFKDGKMEEAVELQHRIIAPNAAVSMQQTTKVPESKGVLPN